MSNKVEKYIKGIQKELTEILIRNGAIITNSHLVLTSKNHSSGYINMRKIAGKTIDNATIGAFLGEAIYKQVKNEDYYDTDTGFLLIGPETMGRSLAHETAYYCGEDNIKVNYVWCEPSPDKLSMQWNPKIGDFPDMVNEAHCIIVDDVLTTAKTLKQTIDLIESTGGIVEGVIVVVRRDSRVTAETVGVPWLLALYEANLQDYDPDNCPLCQKKVPMILRPGHGYDWIKEHPNYPTVT